MSEIELLRLNMETAREAVQKARRALHDAEGAEDYADKEWATAAAGAAGFFVGQVVRQGTGPKAHAYRIDYFDALRWRGEPRAVAWGWRLKKDGTPSLLGRFKLSLDTLTVIGTTQPTEGEA